MRIYVAGPYTAPTANEVLRNVYAAIDAGIALVRLGHAPLIPHLTHFVDLRARETGVAISYEDYLAWDLEWLRASDALLFLGSSAGADRELKAAWDWDKPVFRSIDDVPTALLVQT